MFIAKIGERLCPRLGEHAESCEAVDARQYFGEMMPDFNESLTNSEMLILVPFVRPSSVVDPLFSAYGIRRVSRLEDLDPVTENKHFDFFLPFDVQRVSRTTSSPWRPSGSM